MIDPGEVLRPARAAEWIPALQEAVEHVAQDDRAWALGFAAALAFGLGRDDQAAGCLGPLAG